MCSSNLLLRTTEKAWLYRGLLEVESLFGFVAGGENGEKTRVLLGTEARSGERLVAREVESEV